MAAIKSLCSDVHVTGSPTLWGSFAFLATVRLPFLSGGVYVLVDVVRTGVDAVVGQRLVLAGRGRDGMRTKPSRQTHTNQLGSPCLTRPGEESPRGRGLCPLNMDCSGLAGLRLTGCLFRYCNSLVHWGRSECLGCLDNRRWPTLTWAPPESERLRLSPLTLGRSLVRSLRTGAAGCGSLLTEAKARESVKNSSWMEICTPSFPMTPVAAPSSSGGGMNSSTLMEEGLSGFSEAGASRSRSGRRFLGGGGGTTSSSGVAFEPSSVMSSDAEDDKMKSQ